MEGPAGSLPQPELPITGQQTPKNSQKAPPTTEQKEESVSNDSKEEKEVTLELHKYILLLASLVATVTYAAAFSPPGDVWQDTAADHLAGDPIIRDTHHRRYVTFYYCNATAFASSLVVIVINLILAYLEDKQNNSKGDKAGDKPKEPNSMGNTAEDKQPQPEPNSMGVMAEDKQLDKAETSSKVASFLQEKKQGIALWTLQLVMVVDLLSLMGAYAAGTCRDTFTTIYSSVLVVGVFFYLVIQIKMARAVKEAPQQLTDENKTAALASVPAGNKPQFSSGSMLSKVEQDVGSSGGDPGTEGVEKGEEGQKPKQWTRFRSNNKMAGVVKFGMLHNKVKQDRVANVRFRKVLMLLATFAVSITYSAGLSTPGGFWDTAGVGHRPGDAILKDRHNTRLSVFFGFNTMSFVSSLLIIVVILDTKLRKKIAYGFIFVALVSLIGAYNAGSCREIDTTVYVFSLIAAVLLCILLLYLVIKIKRALKPENPQQGMLGASDGTQEKANGSSEESKTEKVCLFFQKSKTDEKEKSAADKEKSAADKARSLVLLLATLAATITYQAGLDPPGGAWQDNNGGHMAGDPILLTTNRRRYKVFFYCNSVSLVASLVAIVLVQMKFLLESHVLEAVMILDLIGLIGAYAAGSCRDVNTSIHAMALAGAVLVYVVIHVILTTLDDDTRKRRTEEAKKRRNELVEKTRKRLLLFAILVATITYQAGLTPPGGFLHQDDESGNHAGDPVLLYNFPRRYKAFFYCNSVSFMLSIALILLLVNRKLYRPAIRTHALSVCTAVGLFSLMGAFAAGSTQHLKTSVYMFMLVAVVIFFIILLFLVFWFTGCSTSTKVDEGGSSTGSSTNQAVETNTQVPVTAPSNNNTSAGTSQVPGKETDSKEENKKKKIEEKGVHAKRKYLMLLGILVASVTYQAGLQPPGGAWQSTSGWYEAGNPVMHDNRRPRYLAFFYSNSTSFMASLVVIILLLVLPKKLFVHKSWLAVMNTTIVLDLLGLLGAYAAGSSRRLKTSVYVLLLVIAVLAYMVFHYALSCIIKERKNRTSQQHGHSAA